MGELKIHHGRNKRYPNNPIGGKFMKRKKISTVILALTLALVMAVSPTIVFADAFAQELGTEVLGYDEWTTPSRTLTLADFIDTDTYADTFDEAVFVDLIELTETPIRTAADAPADLVIPLNAIGPDPLDPQEWVNGVINNSINTAFNMGVAGGIVERLWRGTLNQAHGDWWNGVDGPVQMDVDWFRFTVNPSSGDTTMRLRVVDGMEVFLFLYDQNRNLIGAWLADNANPIIVNFEARATPRNFFVEITPAYSVDSMGRINWIAEQSNWRQYTLSLLNATANGTFTSPILNPRSVSSPGSGQWSPFATVDLTNNSNIPRTARVTAVTVRGTFRNPLGNSRIEVQAAGMMSDERILSSMTNINASMLGFRDSLVPVRNLWGVRYVTQAWNSNSSIENLTLEFRFVHDVFDGFPWF